MLRHVTISLRKLSATALQSLRRVAKVQTSCPPYTNQSVSKQRFRLSHVVNFRTVKSSIDRQTPPKPLRTISLGLISNVVAPGPTCRDPRAVYPRRSVK